MNVYAVSDLHGNLPAPPRDADLLLLAGDICPDFRPMKGRPYEMVDQTGHKQAAWLDKEFRRWLEAAPCPVVAIWGNHDFIGEHSFLVPSLPWVLLQDNDIRVGSAHPAHHCWGEHDTVPPADVAMFGSLRIYGTPWVPGLPYWAFYGRPEALQARAEAIPAGIDILMTHGPPYRSGDYIPTSIKQQNKYGNYGGAHVGDPTLNDAIERAKPRAVICGHIHEARGTYCLNGATVYNVAAVDEVYNLHDDPFIKIDL